MSIKYYNLAKDETPPEEFCAIRDVNGEPSEYMFYVPEAENAKLREERDYHKALWEHATVTDCELRRVRAAWKKDREQNAKLQELVDGLTWCCEHCSCRQECPLYDVSEPDHCREASIKRELGIEVEA